MRDDIDEIARRVAEQRPQVTVLGAAILDRWVSGHADRLCREAPVPVVDVQRSEDRPGGAANTAANLAGLGARVGVLSLVGDDDDGRRLRALLRHSGVDVSGIGLRTGRTTPCKTRIVADDQILVRTDVSSVLRLTADEQDGWLDAITRLPAEHTLMICDYVPEMFPPEFVARLASRPPRCRIVVDAHDLSRWSSLAPDLVTPNAAEAEQLIGVPLPAGDRPRAAAALGSGILAASHAHRAVITLDRDGTVALDGGRAHTTSARPVPESQTAGAGDTYAAALVAATAVGCDLADAADFAQAAADVVVRRPGTSVCTSADLARSGSRTGRIVTDPRVLREMLRERGGAVVFTNGCFDILHPGHTAYLEQAKALGDVLVVAVNDDDSVRRLKGPERPINRVEDRARVLDALGCVDYVIPFGESSPVGLLALLRPELYVKGGDYTPEMLEETGVVRAYGGQVRTLGYFPSYSTTSLVERMTHTDGATS